MIDIDLKSLIGKLNQTTRRALREAVALCKGQTHYEVEIEHLLFKLNELADGDFVPILRQFEVDSGRAAKQLTRSLDGFKRGNSRDPMLSPRVAELVREAWVLASVQLGASAVRSGHLLLVLLGTDSLRRQVRESCPELERIDVPELLEHFATIVSGTGEDQQSDPGGASAEPQPSRAKPGSKTPSLDQFTDDLTERARRGEIDPILGRDMEIRQVIDILTRRRQNNPILTGEAGVGKTAVVEGLALRIVQGDVPPPLRNVVLRSLDLALLQAGAGVKGEFENRLKSVINEVKSSPTPIIIFIDEAHTMIGAGGAAGQGDAANLLKPALARGELRTVAATTWSEYKKYFEKDPALTRRFQVVKVEEPDESSAVAMIRGLVGTLEEHHKVRILDEAVDSAVRLSSRYISERHLPDKAVSVLDTACARIALGQVATPSAVEDARRRIDMIDTEVAILEREKLTGGDCDERLGELRSERATLEARLAELQAQWEAERALIGRVAASRAKLENHSGKKEGEEGFLTVQELGAEQEALAEINRELRALQGESPLMQPCVGEQTVAEVVSGWTGIPVGKVVKDEIDTLLSLDRVLGERIIGQEHALDAISRRIRTAKAKLEDPRRPIGVFMLVGPSGVGKTETAISLADTLYGGERSMVVINMSEYQESHTVSGLKGSPPGYVGYGEGGVLTEAVRRKPYCVVLLDEMEKAHSDVHELFYQVFDKGTLEDGEGRVVDFKNTIILMTSNVATDTVMKLCADPETRPEPDGLVDAIRPELVKTFKPAFIGRAIVVPYYPITPEVLRKIIVLQLDRIRDRLAFNSRTSFTYEEPVVDAIAARCNDAGSGGRIVDHILTRTMLPEISSEFLGRMGRGENVSGVHIGIGDDGNFRYAFQ